MNGVLEWLYSERHKTRQEIHYFSNRPECSARTAKLYNLQRKLECIDYLIREMKKEDGCEG